MSKHPSPGQPHPQPKLNLLNRIQNATPEGYYVREGTHFYLIYKSGRESPIISWAASTCQCWIETRNEVEAIVHFSVKHWERLNP